MSKATLLFLLCFAAGALGQTTNDLARSARLARQSRLMAIEQRIVATKPERRDNPLRYENLTDIEVREIQAATLQALPDSIVNIGGVVTGCSCEDGSECSDQVWILANRGNRTTGLQLSKVRGHWKLGPVQAWWLEFEALKRKRDSFKDYRAYREAEDAHKERFPACSSNRL